MKFLRILLLPLLSILLVTENQVLGKYYSSHLGESSIEKCSEKIDAKVANLPKPGGKVVKGADNITKAAAEEIKNLPTVRIPHSDHFIEQCAERGLTKKMAEKVIEKGVRYYDPKNKSIVYVLRNGMGSGDHLAVPVNPLSGRINTVYTMRPNYFPKRLIPLD